MIIDRPASPYAYVRKVIRSNETKFELAKYTKDKPALGKHLEVLNQLL